MSEMSQWMYHALATRMNTADSSGILADLNSVAGESGYKAFTTAVVLSFRGDSSKLYFSTQGTLRCGSDGATKGRGGRSGEGIAPRGLTYPSGCSRTRRMSKKNFNWTRVIVCSSIPMV